MTFGEVKTIIENNLLESYKDQEKFKKLLKEFKYFVLNDKKISQLYSLYDQLTTPQGLSENEAKDFLEEGIELIGKIVNEVKLPTGLGSIDNKYKDIDTLVYSKKIDIKERIESKKNVVNTLMISKKLYESKVKLPLDSMVKIANQTMNSYLSNLDENSKKEFFEILNEDSRILEDKFISLKESSIAKLKSLISLETQSEMKSKLQETIEKIDSESFDYLSYFKLKNLSSSL